MRTNKTFASSNALGLCFSDSWACCGIKCGESGTDPGLEDRNARALAKFGRCLLALEKVQDGPANLRWDSYTFQQLL